MKKFLNLLLAVIMLLGCIPAVAEEFPKLDNKAAWDYIGDWFGVSGLNVMDEPTTEYPEPKLNLYLNGLGDLYLDGGKKEIVGWYVEDGMVFLARTVDNVPQADQIFAYAYKNETGRLVVNLGDCSVICEQEGEEYSDVMWPEFDAEDAKYFIGTWKAVTYISGGEEIPAELVGPMTFVLKDDGTAQSIEGDEEPYELRWYSDYSVAYLGENQMELVEISFDGNGNISVKMDAETTVIMAPFAETGTILGTWEDSSKTVEITEDGKLKLIYKSDGYTNHMQWEMADDMPTVTLGTWQGATIVFADGKLVIDTNGLHYEFTRVGEVPDIYVGPGGFVVADDDASAPFIGNWVEKDDYGVLTFNEDFTAVMNFTDGRMYDFNWKTTETGAIFTSGMWFDTAMVIEDENTLNIGDGWMILYREGTESSEELVAQPIGPEGEPYFGTWTMDLGGMAMTLILNQDGTCAMEMMGEAEPGVWTMENGKAYVMGDEIAIDGDGNLVMESQGMVFVKAEDAAEAGSETAEDDDMAMLMAMLGAMEDGTEAADPDEMSDEEAMMLLMAMLGAMEEQEELAAESVDPYIGVKFEMTGSIVQGMVLTAEQLGCAGDYVIFNADGSAKLVMGGIDVQTLGWTRGAVTVLGEEYEDGFSIDYYGTYYNFAITEEGLLLDYFGMLRTYERADGESAPSAAAPVADPYVDKKFLCTGSIVQGMKLSAEQLGCAGDYVIFNADGSVELVMSSIPVQTLGWKRGTVNVAGVEYEGFAVDYYGTIYNFATTEEGLLLDYFGMVRTYEAE